MKVAVNGNILYGHKSGVHNYIRNIIKGIESLDREEVEFVTLYEHKFLSDNALSPKRALWDAFLFPIYSSHKQVDLIHSMANIKGPMIKGKQPLVVSLHDLTPFLYSDALDGVDRIYWHLSIKKQISLADLFIVPSKNTRKDLSNLFMVPESDITVIPCGVDHNIFNEFKINNTFNEYNYILYLGDLVPRKNLRNLIKAYYKLGEKKYSRLFIGGTGPERKELEALVHTLGITDRVTFLGRVAGENLPALYQNADLVVYPSLYEGFGLPPLEAMACGTPVITSNTSSLPEVVGDSAITVNPFDVESLAESMLEVLNNENLKQKMIRKGLKRAKEFTWERAAKETLKVYEKALGK